MYVRGVSASARLPAQCVGSGGELLRPLGDESRPGGSLAAGEDRERDPGRLPEPKQHDCGVAEPVAVRGDRRESRTVASERRAVARDRDVAQQRSPASGGGFADDRGRGRGHKDERDHGSRKATEIRARRHRPSAGHLRRPARMSDGSAGEAPASAPSACGPAPARRRRDEHEQLVDEVGREERGCRGSARLRAAASARRPGRAPAARPRAAPLRSSSSDPSGSGPRPNARRRGCSTAPTSRAVSAGRPRAPCPCRPRPRPRPPAARARGGGSPRRRPSASRAPSRARPA